MELVALKIEIKRKIDPNNQKGAVNDYPDFNSLPAAVRDNLDWCHFIDQYSGWQYDHESGFGESDSFNPDPKVQYGVFMVPQDFADAAMAAFPTRVTQLDEADLETFYNDRAHRADSELNYDEGVLSGLQARYGKIPVAKKALIEFFTDTDQDGEAARIAEYEVEIGRTITAREQSKIDKLCEMEPSDCKAINPTHPSPGIKKNKNATYQGYKNKKGFTIAIKP
jgi:hypothetical protein